MLDGYLLLPAGAGPFPAIVALHGCGGLYAQKGPHQGDLTQRHRDWGERLRAEGYVVLFPDSFGSRGVKEVCSLKPQPVQPGVERSRDTYGALQYLQRLPFVLAQRVGLLGWSNGAMTVLETLAKDTAARPAGLEHDFVVAVGFYPGCRAVEKRRDWWPVAPLCPFGNAV